MAESNSIMLMYEQDGVKVKFQLYMFPLDLIPQLIHQLREHRNFELEKVCRVDFQAARDRSAANAGITPEKQLSLALKLKNY